MALSRSDQAGGVTGEPKVDTLKVPGASLYYEVRGSGPVLLMIPGGPTDAGVFSVLAGLLADEYTVVTYDPRGNSRSVLDGPPEAVPVEVHADDAQRLIKTVGTEPVYVLGSSGGAVIGLDLVVRHPERVNTLVAHEPPVMELLPDSARWRELVDEVYETYRTDGAFVAMEKFGDAVDEGGPKWSDAQPQDEPTPKQAEMMGRMMGNFEFFLAHVMRTISSYVPDVDAFKASSTRIVVGGGEESGQQGAYRAAVALAERLGQEVVYFPGAHGGFTTHSEVFAERLHRVLRGGQA
jgi:pimeloyl-ACP methyl ester carboxylesterase